MWNIQGKIIFITGGASGIGLQAAREFAARGAHVVIFNRKAQAARDAIAEIERERIDAGQRICSYLLDVAERDQVGRGFAQAAQEVGAPDIVINMAAIGNVAAMPDMTYEDFDHTIKVNVYGTRNVVEAALKVMRRPGTIVLAGSLGGFIPVYGYTGYGTSKFAVVGFSQCLRYELKPLGIDVSCFCPGEVATPGLAGEYANTHPATVAMKAIGSTISCEAAVRGLIAGIAARKFLIMPGWQNKLLYWMTRLTPLPIWNFITDAIVGFALRRKPRL
ncbi:MAG: SDR family NAD(P)-dependent oxidoreductase [Burkholderiaceae bacterium]|nr:SDR family NAD(P)-dependent oxidoreductase [Burkholderiaceae bacterium]